MGVKKEVRHASDTCDGNFDWFSIYPFCNKVVGGADAKSEEEEAVEKEVGKDTDNQFSVIWLFQ